MRKNDGKFDRGVLALAKANSDTIERAKIEPVVLIEDLQHMSVDDVSALMADHSDCSRADEVMREVLAYVDEFKDELTEPVDEEGDPNPDFSADNEASMSARLNGLAMAMAVAVYENESLQIAPNVLLSPANFDVWLARCINILRSKFGDLMDCQADHITGEMDGARNGQDEDDSDEDDSDDEVTVEDESSTLKEWSGDEDEEEGEAVVVDVSDSFKELNE